jgi:hypothetical protein
MKSKTFRISISSPPDRERLVADIFVGNTQWAELNQEQGSLTLELYPRQDGKPWVFDYEEVLIALQAAKERLVGSDESANANDQ